jgi:hypothetical protein
MIRVPEPGGWLLVSHQEHALLAGRFAAQWGNEDFAAPEPREAIVTAVARHDDGWIGRDAAPSVTPEGLPSAFSQELVGTYAAFEEVGLADYLRVRGEATEAVARDNPYAAILISMHTVNLLTQQMDPATLGPEGRDLHHTFVEGQRRRQAELRAKLALDVAWRPFLEDAVLERAFRFLQCCDNLSLLCCARFPRPATLRHAHPDRLGRPVEFHFQPLNGGHLFRVHPSPFAPGEMKVRVPGRYVRGERFASDSALRAAWTAGEPRWFEAVVVCG